MKILSKRIALQSCWSIWKEAPTNGDEKEKISNNVAEKINFQCYDNFSFYEECPCCEYKNQDCENCLLIDLWTMMDDDNVENYNIHCELANGSPYHMWKDEKLRYDRDFFALLIAEESKRLILEGK